MVSPPLELCREERCNGRAGAADDFLQQNWERAGPLWPIHFSSERDVMRHETEPEQARAGNAPEPAPPAVPSPPPAADGAAVRGGETASPGSTDGAEALREDIGRTRDRMSRTLDRIEGRIARRRDEVWSKATLQDVRARIASEPWRGLLIAFAAGYVLAALRD
jgi:hypothetical protein